ncbi:MAG: tetratricopeptide repeat protein [Candidatus Aminicenantes bacterium]|nr:MAG: tetratricopeptide repeat protein [Candidatus Aminicenantes bacterium]
MKFKKITLVIFISLSLILCASSQKKIEEARKKDPQYQYNLGLFYLNEGNIEEAIRYFNKALSLNPRYALALNSIGMAYLMSAKFQDAINYFEKCLEINPGLTEAHNNLGVAYQEMGFIDQAEKEFRTALADEKYKSKDLAYFNLARLYVLKERLQEALEYVERALGLNTRNVQALNLKGIIYEKQGDFPEAIRSYRQAAKYMPNDIDLNFNLAVAYFKNNQFLEARTIFENIYPQATDPEMKKKITEYLKIINK